MGVCVRWWILIKCSMGLYQGEGLLMFVLRGYSEKFRVKNKLFVIFVDLEKAFDRVPREVICFALR